MKHLCGTATRKENRLLTWGNISTTSDSDLTSKLTQGNIFLLSRVFHRILYRDDIENISERLHEISGEKCFIFIQKERNKNSTSYTTLPDPDSTKVRLARYLARSTNSCVLKSNSWFSILWAAVQPSVENETTQFFTEMVSFACNETCAYIAYIAMYLQIEILNNIESDWL